MHLTQRLATFPVFALACAIVIGMATAAQADPIDFEAAGAAAGLTYPPTDTSDPFKSYDDPSGFTFVGNYDLVYIIWDATTTTQLRGAIDWSTIKMTKTAGGTFDLYSVDVGVGTTVNTSAQTVRVVAYKDGSIFDTLLFNDFTTAYETRTITLPDTWRGLSEARFACGANPTNYNDARVVIDNLYTTPEPATMAMLGLGGLVTVCRRRR